VADELDRREDRELEIIQRQMEQTRANLGDKLEKLESHVVGTVTAATDTVSDAVQGVKDVVGTVTESVAAVSTSVTETASAVSDTVSGTVASVADTLNIAKQIEAHPWGAFGAAVGLGFLGSLLLGSSEKKAQPSSSGSSDGSWFHSPPAKGAPSESLLASAPSSAASASSSWLGQDSPVGQLLSQATEGVTDLSLNAIMGVVRELTASLPETFREPANKFVDSMATDLGVPNKVLADNPPIQPSSQTGAANGAPQQGRQPDNPAFNRSRASMSA
jgi:uncharacterized protein YoxC